MSKIQVVESKWFYKIVAEFNAGVLGVSVEECLNDGWSLHGEPFVFGEQLCQAMKKAVLV